MNNFKFYIYVGICLFFSGSIINSQTYSNRGVQSRGEAGRNGCQRMKLVDTSSWVEQLRRGGDETVRERVEALLTTGEAAWCPVVRLELWNRARGDRERKVLRQMEKEITSLEIGAEVCLFDRDISITFRRAWTNMGFFEKLKLFWNFMNLFFIVFTYP